MKKPISWNVSPPFTVVPKDRRVNRSSNPGGKTAILRFVEAQSNGALGRDDRDVTTNASLPPLTIQPAKSSVSHELLTYLGHSESCAVLRRKGLIAACDCYIKPFEDPAVTIGLVIHFARMSLAHKGAIPPVLIELLARQVEAGDAACIMVAEWLDAMGLAEMKPVRKRRAR